MPHKLTILKFQNDQRIFLASSGSFFTGCLQCLADAIHLMHAASKEMLNSHLWLTTFKQFTYRSTLWLLHIHIIYKYEYIVITSSTFAVGIKTTYKLKASYRGNGDFTKKVFELEDYQTSQHTVNLYPPKNPRHLNLLRSYCYDHGIIYSPRNYSRQKGYLHTWNYYSLGVIRGNIQYLHNW